MTNRTAVYARYSSDHQSERSIDDQLSLCRDYAAKNGLEILETFSDAAISGASTINRPGVQALMAGVRAGRFDAILCEALDRLSRGQGDIAKLVEEIEFRGAKLITVQDGAVNEMVIGLKGTMNAMTLKDTAAKVRRGQRGRALDGLTTGSIAYGYDVVKAFDEKGEVLRGHRTINPAEAAIVRRIFEEYAAGKSVKAIARDLNRAGVPAARGGSWGPSTITGERARRNGVLWNEIYTGRLIYNRQRFVKDPATGRRVPRVNPESEWVRADVPGLRIISDDLWARAHAVMDAHRRHDGGPVKRRAKRLLAGILVCGTCGGPYTAKSADVWVCSGHRMRGTCDNGRTIRIARVEENLLAKLAERLLDPDLITIAAKAYREEMSRLLANRDQRTVAIAKERQATQAAIGRIVAAVEAGSDSPALHARLRELEARLKALEAEAGAQAGLDKVVALHPQFAAAWTKRVEGMTHAISAHGFDLPAARGHLQTMVDRIVVPKKGEEAEVIGQPDALIALLGNTAGTAVGLMSGSGGGI